MDCFLNYYQITVETAVKFLTSSVCTGISMYYSSSFLLATTIQINSKCEIPPNIFTLHVSPSGVWLFCKPMDCSPPGSSVRVISQAWILEWVAISFSRRSSRPRDGTCLSLLRWQADSLPLHHLRGYSLMTSVSVSIDLSPYCGSYFSTYLHLW